MQNIPDQPVTSYTLITEGAPIAVNSHGGRAKCLQRLTRLNMPVPRTVALSFDCVRGIAQGQVPDAKDMLASFGDRPVVSVRPSSEDPDWGGPGAILNIGMNAARHKVMAEELGQEAADRLYTRFVQSYAVHVARLDPDEFEVDDSDSADALKRVLEAYEFECEEEFPQDPAHQLEEVLRSMARAWEGTTARLLRQAKGAPADAGLGLVVQEMIFGLGSGECGSGVIRFINPQTGHRQIEGRYKRQSQGRDALDGDAVFLQKDARGTSMEELCPKCYATLTGYGASLREKLREEMEVEFVVDNGELRILDAIRVQRTSPAAVRVAVDLANDKIIPREEALLRIEPRALTELLHRQVNPDAPRDVLLKGIAASPGAATGKIVFSATAAQASQARDEACILVRRETAPEDIRGMHAASAVLTERGGMSSHAAVIARGLGLPCIVGASDLKLKRKEKRLILPDGRELGEGDLITVDGSSGDVLDGAAELLEPTLEDGFRTLLTWAEDVSDIKVRANADTPADAEIARRFRARGIGLCRTEHMFFEHDRLTLMREMIFANSPDDRAAALDRLLPMQRADFKKLFEIMRGERVCIRLFDPPLHEFLPHTREGMRELAGALDLPLSDVERRVKALSEFNPMLGMRGVRLGITVPEIYDMQARAIFEAAAEVSAEGQAIIPEVMIPLVSAMREVEIVKARIDLVAAQVRAASGVEFDFRLGVMVETPRAALRAEEIAPHVSFLSFGTNDLTQMTYGLSRDDAGRFMSEYVRQEVYAEDPFHTLDTDGVGELLEIGAERARRSQPDVTLSICGEHGGNPESIAFCRQAGFDYVSCSPFRVPVAWLAGAHLALMDQIEG